jgi:transposase InsO family protein
MKYKYEFFTKFKEFKARVEKKTGKKIICLRIDRGGKYLSQDFIAFCTEHGIQWQLTMAHTSQQNGVSERRNRTLIEWARSMATDSNCPTFLWTEVINTANHLVNLSPTRVNYGLIPDEKFYSKKPRVDHLRIFGSICYLHIPKEKRYKLDSKSIQCFFLGYDKNSKVYRVFEPTSKKIHLSRDIVFDENLVGYQFL